MNNNVIELKGLTKSFKKNNVKVLKNINFVFKKGKIYSLTGPSGSGKSTLLNILSMIDRPTRGNLFINRKKINFDNIEINDQIRAKNIGIIYQDSNLLSDFNALENITISRLAIENNEKKAIFDAKKLLKKFKLLKRSSHFPNELSGGESQRIAISRALINSPDIIMADEPSGSLDNKNSKDVFKSLFQLKNKNRVIIFATHNMYFAKMADCKLELDNGIIKSTNG